MSVLQLADAKRHLNLPAGDTAQDAEVQDTIDSAEALVANRCGPLTARFVTERISGGTTQLLLDVRPVITLTSVTPIGGTPLALSSLYLDADAGIIEAADGRTGFSSRTYTVVYLAGRADVPDDLLYMIREITRLLWSPQQGPVGNRAGGQKVGPKILAQIDELLAPWEQVSW